MLSFEIITYSLVPEGRPKSIGKTFISEAWSPVSCHTISCSEAHVSLSAERNPDQSKRLLSLQGRAVSMTLVSLLWTVLVSMCLGKEGLGLYL